jgi:cytochrome c oxidase cbb3-type subunit 3
MQAQGVADMAPALRNAFECQQVKATTLAHVILAGIAADPVDLPMPAFHDELSDRQVASVITYFCSKWSGRAPTVEADEVARLRRNLAGVLSSRPKQPPVDEHDDREIRQGQRFYGLFHCDSCHAQGGGDIGPALMDDRWRYGGDMKHIHDSIAEGRPNGMPAFGSLIPDRQIWQIAAYVRSLD